MPSPTLLRFLQSNVWLPYAFALAAAGLLPVKARLAYRAVAVFLALLWTWLALAAWGSHPWAVLAAGEAALFVIFGAIPGWFELRVRKGFWAVAGTSFIIYALLVFPLLGRFLGVKAFAYTAFGAPIPIVLFTCGVLFFSIEPIAAFAFVAPLLWALMGGPSDGREPAELVGLQVALLAGALFLVLPFELRQGDGRRPAPGAAYRTAYRRRAVFGYGLWALILTTLMLFFLWPATGPWQVTVNLALLSALGVVLWLAFPAWQSLWYRSVAWWMARAGGRIWLGVRDGWTWGVLLLAAAALWVWLVKLADPWQRIQYGEWPLRLFVMALFLWVAYHAVRGRKRLLIGAFSPPGEDALDKSIAAGLGKRLQTELARIADLYRVIDEMSPSPKGPVIEVTPGVLEVGEILKDASAITFGPLKIPANFFVGLIGRIVSGPRLTGALHKIDGRFMLTAEISGGGRSSSWRVDHSDLTEEEARLPPAAAVQKLVEQLAFRVATDRVSIGSLRWRAVRCYTEGLRFYREAAQQKRSRQSRLRDAERCFIRALNEDQEFAKCHYNLGVTYRQLKENRSAQAAFRRALKQDPADFEACYALAEALVDEEKYQDGVWFSEAAIGIQPSDARAWVLGAYAFKCHSYELYLAKAQADPSSRANPSEVAAPPTDPSWKEVCELSEIAVALAWRTLCRRELIGTRAMLQREKDTALMCTRDLAVWLARSMRYAESRQVFRQAARLPHHPDLQLYEGRTLFWDRSPEGAATALEGVFADGMDSEDQGVLWSLLAQVYARSGPVEKRRERTRLAHQRFLDVAAGASAQDLKLSFESPPGTRSHAES